MDLIAYQENSKTMEICSPSFTSVTYNSHISDRNIQHLDMCYENKEKASTAVVHLICIWEVYTFNLSYVSNTLFYIFLLFLQAGANTDVLK
jgi:hypothetical protein